MVMESQGREGKKGMQRKGRDPGRGEESIQKGTWRLQGRGLQKGGPSYLYLRALSWEKC